MPVARAVVSWFKRRILRDKAERWNHAYTVGKWERLKLPVEEDRLDACARLLLEFAPNARVLEIGCGEALLQRRLKPGDYSSWLGVDISEVAIARAREFAGTGVRYEAGDLNTLEPEGQFDAIIFSESIYYAKHCGEALRRYARHLAPGGFFIVSIHASGRSPRRWSEIHSVTAAVASIETVNKQGRWNCEALNLR